jgi:hypothetical protein
MHRANFNIVQCIQFGSASHRQQSSGFRHRDVRAGMGVTVLLLRERIVVPVVRSACQHRAGISNCRCCRFSTCSAGLCKGTIEPGHERPQQTGSFWIQPYCCPSGDWRIQQHFRFWHFSDMARYLTYVRYVLYSGHGKPIRIGGRDAPMT